MIASISIQPAALNIFNSTHSCVFNDLHMLLSEAYVVNMHEAFIKDVENGFIKRDWETMWIALCDFALYE